jgi:indole-3-glycerol phosphate synthase
MSNILEQICEFTRTRIERQKTLLPLNTVIAEAESKQMLNPKDSFVFERALCSPGISFICEIKRASPSKGIIADEFDYIKISREYQAAGAAAISVLTEPNWFKGADEDLRQIADRVTIPLLRKDFVVDEYMIYEAKLLGAGAILLICSVLDGDTISRYIEIADSLGLCSLVETHDEGEIETALKAGARIIGVNNRNLKTFEVDISLSERLRKLVPQGVFFVAESGISTRSHVARLEAAGVDGVLIGESLMRSSDKVRAIAELRGNL